MRNCDEKEPFAQDATAERVDSYKIYAESFCGENHLRRVLGEAQAIISGAFASAH